MRPFIIQVRSTHLFGTIITFVLFLTWLGLGKERRSSSQGQSQSRIRNPYSQEIPPQSGRLKDVSTDDFDANDQGDEQINGEVLPPSSAKRLAHALQDRYFAAEGFDFCKILDGSTFDATSHVWALGGTVAEINPSMLQFTETIDAAAEDAHNRLLKQYSYLMKQDVYRYSCYAAADGSNTFTNVSTHPLVHRINPQSYFGELIPSIKPRKSVIPGPRRRYPLAYLLMLHDIQTFNQSQKLIEQLDDGTAVFLVHIDKRASVLRKSFLEWVDLRNSKLKKLGNVFVAKTSFEGMWGHASLVWMQLSGYWELLDLADWDYTINLSGYDWPLRTSAEIYRTLNSTKHRGREHIQYWTQNSDSANRLIRPHLGRADRPSLEWSLMHPQEVGLNYYPFRAWRPCKQHQWTILTRDFIQDLRTNADSLHLLAFMEHTWIPDEAYFCMVVDNHPVFSHRVIKDNKRYLRFYTQHPVTLTIEDKKYFKPQSKIGDEAQYFFVRKVNMSDSTGLIDWIRTNHIEKHRAPNLVIYDQF
ncbi:core-2/I-branching enzyme-domain-containing protein [Phlyctochytrium arcticum]|nr:core-2/I-branching enzyme-domain-containing protein [Phlyctochytrium arcticum]